MRKEGAHTEKVTLRDREREGGREREREGGRKGGRVLQYICPRFSDTLPRKLFIAMILLC